LLADWASHAGPAVLLQAHGAIQQYGVHLVVGNMLHTRKDRVYLVTERSAEEEQLGQPVVQEIERPAGEPVIEKLLVAQVVAAHQRYIAAAKNAGVRT
jgi:hypothetical protein